MAVPITNMGVFDIIYELGLTPGIDIDQEQLFLSNLVNANGLDHNYCPGAGGILDIAGRLTNLRSKPYDYGKWRNYTHIQAVTSALKGRVTSAMTGLALNNAVITPTKNGQSPVTGTTNSAGYYFLWLAPGEYSVTYALSGYITHATTITIPAETEVSYEVSLTPTFTGSRFVLNWGEYPTDYDLCLHLPFTWNNGADRQNAVYWSAKGNINSIPWALLDHDDTNGFGPETLTIYSAQSGTYQLCVHCYSEQIPLVGSGARVTVYNNTDQSLTINIDDATVINSGTPIQNIWWYVCNMDGTTKEITIINEIRNVYPF